MTSLPAAFQAFVDRAFERAHAAAPADNPQRWFKLPGGRLELARSGFVITLKTESDQPPYVLHDPEGRLLGAAVLLQPLKQLGEQHAGDRAEFEP